MGHRDKKEKSWYFTIGMVLMLMCFGCKTVFAQNTNKTKDYHITGQVKDENGESIIGANISVLELGKGTITDVNGNFSLNFKSEDKPTICIRFIGMQEYKKLLTRQDMKLDVVLSEAVNQLGDVVITGYQTISKERATGAYNIMKKDALEKPTTNIASRLIGAMAGVQATLDKNGDPKFEIRGLTTLGSNASPLVVVDGFAIEGDFNSINPNDVESVTILKDAAAASIWGARSGNGVIVVTTKNASKLAKGKVAINYSNFFKFSPKMDLDYVRPYASSSEIVDYELQLFNKRWGFKPVPDSKQILMTGSSFPTREILSEHANGYLTDEQRDQQLNAFRTMDNRSQIEKYLLNNPFTQQHNLSLGYSSDKVNTYTSVMYQSRNKQLKGNSDEKAIINLKSDFKLLKNLSLNLGTTFMYINDQNNNIDGLPEIHPYQMLVGANGERLDIPTSFYMPNMKRYIPMDKFPYSDWGSNPITNMENTDNTTKTLLARFQAGINVRIFDGLSFKGSAQYEMKNMHNRKILNENTFTVRSTINRYTQWDGADNFVMNVPKGSIFDQNRSEYSALALRGMLNFDREFGQKHVIAAVVGVETNMTTNSTTTEPTIYGYDQKKLTVGTFPNGTGSNTNPNQYIYDWMGYKFTIPQIYKFGKFNERYLSMYANANYTYDGKYSLSASARSDASNLITDDPALKYNPFWSVGASWQIVKENFMKDYTWIDLLTLRATYGFNGNIDKSTAFKPLINLGASQNNMTQDPYASIASYGNPTLRWEKIGTINIGADFSLFRGKLFGNINYYSKLGKDMMSKIDIPAVYGTSSQKLNTAEMINRGIELELGTELEIIPRELTWRGNFNVSYNYNKVTKLFASSYFHSDLIPWNSAKATYVEGYNANSIWGLKYAGLQNVGTASAPNMQPIIIGKDGMKYGLDKWPAGDPMSYIYHQGTSVAPWIFGFNSSFSYKNFNLSFILTAKVGHVFQRTFYNYGETIPNKFLKELKGADPDKVLPLPQNDQESRYNFWNRFWPFFDNLTTSASHIRMQELALSYDFSSQLIKKAGLSQLRLFAQMNDVFSIYANKYGEDPEFKLGTSRPQTSVTFGVKVGF